MNFVRTSAHHRLDGFRELARRLDRRVGARSDDRARDGTGAPLFAERKDNVGQGSLAGRIHNISRTWALPAHAHVERSLQPERETAPGRVELHGRHPQVEHDSIDSVESRFACQRIEIGEPVLKESQTASRLLDEIGTQGSGGLIAIDAADLAVGGGQDCTGITAGAKRGIDVDAPVAWLQILDRGSAEHGNVEGRSASDSRAAAARRHSRAPSASRAATWDPSSPLSARTFWVASASSLLKRPGSQI